MMTFARTIALTITAAISTITSPASAKVQESSEIGFVVRHLVTVTASPDEAWERVLHPEDWWSGAHSYSGDAANFTLDPRAGGCFCEMLPAKGNDVSTGLRGSVEHMRVVYIEKPRALRMSGALGPLQSDALTGTLTIFLRPGDAGTQILFEYVVGGYFRQPVEAIAPAVDAVIGQQVASLGAGLGARTDADANSESVSGGADRAVTDKESTTQFDREMEAIKGEERSPAEAADPEPDSMPEADPAPESGAVQDAPFIGR